MAGPIKLRQLDSVEQLREVTPAWDRLWHRSAVSLPTVRAEPVAQWVEQFAPRAAFRGLVVEQDDKLLAALPLAGRRTHRVLPVGDLTSNDWSPNGELLLDPEADPNAMLGLLADGLDETPWPLLWLDLVPLETPRWQSLVRVLSAKGLRTDLHLRYRIGVVDTRGDYGTYLAGRSRSHRQGVRKSLRRLKRDGPVDLEVCSALAPEEIDGRLRVAFDVERTSWKGEHGTPVLDAPGMFDFYCRLARRFAQWGYLRLTFLKHRGKPIAFELGWTAKGVYHCFKIGYDAAYRRYGPGHLLRMGLYESLFEAPGHLRIDFQGPLTEAVTRWQTGTYPVGRLVIAPRRAASRALLTGYRAVATVIRRIRALRSQA
ncbi:MAG: GNAT family N-acetyltransferase [Planctomycetota bacterium]|jgi:CelD/BcsL family acetyltransferase involved in cellulose biosynthesis